MKTALTPRGALMPVAAWVPFCFVGLREVSATSYHAESNGTIFEVFQPSSPKAPAVKAQPKWSQR